MFLGPLGNGPAPFPGRVLERQPPPYPLAWEVFPASLSVNKRLSVPCLPAALPAATTQVWEPNLCGCRGWSLLGGLTLGLRGPCAISLTPVLSIRSLTRKSTMGTRPNTQGGPGGLSAQPLPGCYTPTPPPPRIRGGFLPWRLGVVTIACLPLRQTWVHAICIVLRVILTISL